MRIIGLALAVAALAGCQAETVKLKVTVPAKTKVVGVRGIAVGGFTIESLDGAYADATGRSWNVQPLRKNQMEGLVSDVKNDVMSSLAELPFYTIVDLEGIENVYNIDGLSGLVGKPTFKPGQVDAIVFGRVWVGYLEMDGIRSEKQTLEHWDYRGKQARLVDSHEEQVQSNYKEASAVMVVQYTFVRLQPRLEVMLVSTQIESIREDEGGGISRNVTRGDALGMLMSLASFAGGGKKEGKTETSGGKPAGGSVPVALEVFAYLAQQTSRRFVESISPTSTTYELEIADGDKTSANLIKAGAYREASKRLREITKGTMTGSVKYKEDKDKAPDFYNLGLAWEAQGPGYFEDAIIAYRKAVESDPEKEDYATGLGRIARLIEGTNLIDLQRNAREE